MRRVLACDIGARRTGVALGDAVDGTVVALDVLELEGAPALAASIDALIVKHHVDVLVLGLPLLPGGDEGAQTQYVRKVAKHLNFDQKSVVFLDERYSTDSSKSVNGDAKAACDLIEVYMARRDLTKS